MKRIVFYIMLVILWSCSDDQDSLPTNTPESDSFLLPVVVHILHNGEAIGEGPNISEDRILRQIEIINEDFGRKANTRGFNEHPDSRDSKITFVLARHDPQGNPTSGIVRVKYDIEKIPEDLLSSEYEQYAYLSYWNASDYINIWVAPYSDNLANVLLGTATGPDSELPGTDLLAKPLPSGAEGVVINWAHFGESDLEGGHHLGRTLTHELGHYLGLLHTWGDKNCATNDYCDDTPAVDHAVTKSEPYIGCDDEAVMTANYMNYSPDEAMNIFTNDQIDRMHHVLLNSPRRTSLLSSPGLLDP